MMSGGYVHLVLMHSSRGYFSLRERQEDVEDKVPGTYNDFTGI